MNPRTERKRTVASAFTYRVASTLVLWIITYLVSGQFIDSMFITVTFAILATGVFYFNDRAWERTDWGRKADATVGRLDLRSSQPPMMQDPQGWSEYKPLQHEFLEEAS